MIRSGALFAVLVLLAPLAASATVLPATDVFERIGAAGHPREEVLVVPVSAAVPGSVRACIEYGSTLLRARGRIAVRVELWRRGRMIEQASFGGRVRKTEHLPGAPGIVYYGCTGLGEIESSLRAGDRLVFHLGYESFPVRPSRESVRNAVRALTVGVIR